MGEGDTIIFSGRDLRVRKIFAPISFFTRRERKRDAS